MGMERPKKKRPEARCWARGGEPLRGSEHRGPGGRRGRGGGAGAERQRDRGAAGQGGGTGGQQEPGGHGVAGGGCGEDGGGGAEGAREERGGGAAVGTGGAEEGGSWDKQLSVALSGEFGPVLGGFEVMEMILAWFQQCLSAFGAEIVWILAEEEVTKDTAAAVKKTVADAGPELFLTWLSLYSILYIHGISCSIVIDVL